MVSFLQGKYFFIKLILFAYENWANKNKRHQKCTSDSIEMQNSIYPKNSNYTKTKGINNFCVNLKTIINHVH